MQIHNFTIVNSFRPGLNSNNDNQQLTAANDFPKFPSLVDQLKAVQNAKKNDGDIDAICAKNASEASKKLLTQLKTMDKDGVKDLINNPKQPYKKKVLNLQAREKLREQMRKKLKVLGTEGDCSEFQLEPDECIDYERIPETLISQIGRTIDMSLDDMDLSESLNETIEDKDIEVVKQNLGQDFLMGSEMLLMNGFSLLGETDNEAEFKSLDDSIPKIPPLPAEIRKPPSPPPEPVTPVADPVRLPVDKAVFSSNDKPWSPLPVMRPSYNERFADDDWDIESAKNPDPPSLTAIQIPQISATPTPPISVTPTPVQAPSKTPSISVASTPKADEPVVKPKGVEKKSEIDDEWDKAPVPVPTPTPTAEEPKPDQAAQPDTAQRANETYGEYRRRLNSERQKEPEIEASSSSINTNTNSTNNNNNNNRPNDFNRFQPRNQQRTNDDKNSNRFNRADNWVSNNRGRNNQTDSRNNNQNDSRTNRKSRFDMDRGRDRQGGNFQRNLSRDTNNSHDSGRQDKFDEVKDVHNYRFNAESNSQEPDIERLTSILNPKPLQFKGSFNVKSQNTGSKNRSERNRTPVNNSVERDFDEHLLPLPTDVRPCLTTLRKLMEIDAEITKLHDKIHGIDKVISNLQSERIGYQKSFSTLQHDRKILFDNLMKRAMSSADGEQTRDKSNSREPNSSHKAIVEKKLQNIVNQKKRNHDDQIEEPKKKKSNVEAVFETTSAAAKAEVIRKEKEEEERRQKLVEKKKLRQLRREREEAEKARLEEKIRKEAAATTTITIKQEPRDKSVDKVKSKPAPPKPKEPVKILFKANEILQVTESYKIKTPKVTLTRIPLAQNLIDSFQSRGSLFINVDDWNKWCMPIKSEKIEKVKPAEELQVIPESIIDPLAVEENLINPPTPGSSIENEDAMLVEIQTEQDFSEWSGNFAAHEAPIVHLINVQGKFVVAASEDGKVFKYHLRDGKLAAVFSKHTEICNALMYDDRGYLHSVSSDGFLHKIKFKVRKFN